MAQLVADLHESPLEIQISGVLTKRYEHYLALVRARLTETEFQMEQVAGRTFSLQQAMEYAQNLPLKSAVTPAIREKPDDLTLREHEVICLARPAP